MAHSHREQINKRIWDISLLLVISDSIEVNISKYLGLSGLNKVEMSVKIQSSHSSATSASGASRQSVVVPARVVGKIWRPMRRGEAGGGEVGRGLCSLLR